MSSPSADKQFGQHFLINQGVIDRIVRSVATLNRDSGGTLIEIGPGPGALTKELLALEWPLIAIELDPRMVEFLEHEHASKISQGKLKIISQDALAVDWNRDDFENAYSICGNLPYNVGTAIIFSLLEKNQKANGFCFMLQKEVVQRFMAKPRCKDYGVPSIMLQLLCDIGEHFWVQPGSFNPPPKVQSGVFSFCRKAKLINERLNPFHPQSEYFEFNKFVKRAFQSRRKMLRKVFPDLKESPRGTQRPEELSPEEWWELWELIK